MSTKLEQPSEKQESTKEIYTLGEIIKISGEEPDYLLEPILPRVGTCILVAKPDVGKSQLVRQFSLAIVSGHSEFLSFKLKVLHKSVIYVATEDHAVGISFPIKKQIEGFEGYDENNLIFICADTMSPEEIYKNIHAQLKKMKADLVVIDSFGDIFSGPDINNNVLIRQEAKRFDNIAKKYECNVLFIHHINKATYDRSPDQKYIQGGSGLVQRIRTALFLSEGIGSLKYLAVVKGNYTPKQVKSMAVELEFNEATFTFTETGKQVPVRELGQNNYQTKEIKREELVEIAQEIFGDKTLDHKEIIEKYIEKTGASESTAKRNLAKFLDYKIVVKAGKKYSLVQSDNVNPATTYQIESDNQNPIEL